jgi:uncharacterized ion transporter superfamily protein YfcC
MNDLTELLVLIVVGAVVLGIVYGVLVLLWYWIAGD